MRYFLELSYKGTAYYGWQIQPKQPSVQQEIQEKLSTLLKKNTNIMGAGRTDTGVHAKQMYAHFDSDKELNTPDFLHKINQFLSKDIAIHQIHKVIPNAHARFDATNRAYEYLISLQKNPFNQHSTWQFTNTMLDLDAMNTAANMLLECTDFTSFAKLHTDSKTNLCKVTEAFFVKEKDLITFTIKADRFLRNMVRAIVGTLVDVGKGKITAEQFCQIIEKKDRSFASSSAPAKGLYLLEVTYPKHIFL